MKAIAFLIFLSLIPIAQTNSQTLRYNIDFSDNNEGRLLDKTLFETETEKAIIDNGFELIPADISVIPEYEVFFGVSALKVSTTNNSAVICLSKFFIRRNPTTEEILYYYTVAPSIYKSINDIQGCQDGIITMIKNLIYKIRKDHSNY